MKDKILIVIITFMGTMLILLLIGCLIAFPVMFLWNWLMPVIFGLPVVTVWQALGLVMLSGFFKNINFTNYKNN